MGDEKNASSGLTGKAGTGPTTAQGKDAALKSPSDKNPKPPNDQIQPDVPEGGGKE
ncbi:MULTISPECIES: hypothetical protein [Actinosynnema]|uniref:hypothetical protein n=1 Tax=Actinosynnema TaxID=40566 RepID=UPI0020A432EA|nr:hypothetical protein [Actinosynnema pretiosum]MCP2099425.1 hypothetical protein [Actinosynnema pretiosum]